MVTITGEFNHYQQDELLSVDIIFETSYKILNIIREQGTNTDWGLAKGKYLVLKKSYVQNSTPKYGIAVFQKYVQTRCL